MIKKNLRLSNIEYVSEINSSTDFNCVQYIVNPSRPELFPWLSGIANNFETYKFHELSFIYKGVATHLINSDLTQLGSVIMCIQYNAGNDNFVSKQQMLNYETSVNCRPHEKAEVCVDIRELPLKKFYVDPTQSTFKKLEDPCTFSIATTDMQAGDDFMGELYISYDIEFMVPKIYKGVTVNSLFAHYELSGVTSALPLGTSQTADASNTFAVSFDSGTTVIMPDNVIAGTFIILYDIVGDGTGLNIGKVILSYDGGIENYELFGNHEVNAMTQNSDASNDYQFGMFSAIVRSPSGTILFEQTGDQPATPTAADLFIIQINSSN